MRLNTINSTIRSMSRSLFTNQRFHLGRVALYSFIFVNLTPLIVDFIPGLIPTLLAASCFEVGRNYYRGHKTPPIA